ncbi:MAG TPA: FkbM family methyltransferase [Candidatus Paceibacterota bacterium]|nr:FkbM family methyltransferase [Candidatus Paceibacterota bacterium]
MIKYFYKISNVDYVETIFGKFYLRKNTHDLLGASSSYERRDVNFLIRNISKEIQNEKKILFLDIGADFGYYSILLSNIFKNNKLLKIYSFEPTLQSRCLFERNVKLNNAQNIKILPFAIYKENDSKISIAEKTVNKSNSISLDIKNNNVELVKTITVDSIINKASNFDVLFIKIDIEGFETEALIGAKKILQSNKKIYLMVEDFVDNRVIDFLENTKADFVGKFNNYNSWWKF